MNESYASLDVYAYAVDEQVVHIIGRVRSLLSPLGERGGQNVASNALGLRVHPLAGRVRTTTHYRRSTEQTCRRTRLPCFIAVGQVCTRGVCIRAVGWSIWSTPAGVLGDIWGRRKPLKGMPGVWEGHL